MTKKMAGWLVVGGLAVGIAVVAGVWPVFRAARREALRSAEAAVAGRLVKLQESGAVGADLTGAWRLATVNECQAIMAGGSADGAKWDARSAGMVGPRGEALSVAMRLSETGAFEYRVWSRGGDGVSGTADDVVFPRGCEAPRGLAE